MTKTVRVRFNVKTGEFEIEGSPEFVEKKLVELPEFLSTLQAGGAPVRPAAPRKRSVKPKPAQRKKAKVATPKKAATAKKAAAASADAAPQSAPATPKSRGRKKKAAAKKSTARAAAPARSKGGKAKSSTRGKARAAGKVRGAAKKSASAVGVPALKSSTKFKDWFSKFRKGLSQSDQVLLTGYFVQENSDSSTFSSPDVNQLLKGEGAKISNATANLAQLSRSKKVQLVKKVGRVSHFRVTDAGKAHIASRMN